MRTPKNSHCHQCAPKEWRNTPNFTGSYELDAVIHRNPNRNIPDRLEYYLNSPGTAYESETGYARRKETSGD